jgi:glyoxylase-like metal-dependent hydrolase (beta-lactamase superfamily II)
MRTVIWLVLLVAAVALSPQPGRAQARLRRLPEDASVVFLHEDKYSADRRVGAYVSSSRSFSTSSYFIEGPSGVILIDTQFLPSAADEARRWIELSTGKKVVLAVVLHANPDKFNGTAVLKKHGIRVVTSAQVRALIPAIHEKRKAAFYDRYAPDYPADFTLPDSFGDKTTELSAGGLTVKAHVLGAGCSEAHVVLEFEGHIFPGDLVASGSHSWLEIGRTDEWLKRIAELKALAPQFVHPGRGLTGDERLLAAQECYLKEVMAFVAAKKPRLTADGKLDEAADKALDRVKAKLEARYPGYRYPVFLDIGLPAEWRRQARLPSGTR